MHIGVENIGNKFLRNFPNLEILDLRDNFLQTLENFSLGELKELWLDGKILFQKMTHLQSFDKEICGFSGCSIFVIKQPSKKFIWNVANWSRNNIVIYAAANNSS